MNKLIFLYLKTRHAIYAHNSYNKETWDLPDIYAQA